jgi:carotenoid cleavage dioxygenase-like enzyme
LGRIPDALAGAYYRNGGNLQFDPQGPYFPFLANGMIHAFFFEPNKDGGRARYRNRWVRTPKRHAENKAGRLLFYDPGTPTDPLAAGVNRSRSPNRTRQTMRLWFAGCALRAPSSSRRRTSLSSRRPRTKQ